MKGFKPNTKMSHGGDMGGDGRTHRKIEKVAAYKSGGKVMKKADGGNINLGGAPQMPSQMDQNLRRIASGGGSGGSFGSAKAMPSSGFRNPPALGKLPLRGQDDGYGMMPTDPLPTQINLTSSRMLGGVRNPDSGGRVGFGTGIGQGRTPIRNPDSGIKTPSGPLTGPSQFARDVNSGKIGPEGNPMNMPPRLKKGGKVNWIQGAIKKPGALKKSLGVAKDEKIPAGKLEKASHAPGKMGKRARLAMTLKGMK